MRSIAKAGSAGGGGPGDDDGLHIEEELDVGERAEGVRVLAGDVGLSRLAGVVEKLVVYKEAMQANLDRLGGLVHSQRVLLALTQAGISREESYALVQRHAMAAWQGGARLHDRLAVDPVVSRKIAARDLAKLFDMA